MAFTRKFIVSATICLSLSLIMVSTTFGQTTQQQNTPGQTINQVTEEYNKKYEEALTKVIEIEKLVDTKTITQDIINEVNDKINELEVLLKDLNTNDRNGLLNRINVIKDKINKIVSMRENKDKTKNNVENDKWDVAWDVFFHTFAPDIKAEPNSNITDRFTWGIEGVTHEVIDVSGSNNLKLENNQVYLTNNADTCVNAMIQSPPTYLDNMDKAIVNIQFTKGSINATLPTEWYVGKDNGQAQETQPAEEQQKTEVTQQDQQVQQ
jgi:hypothetical protein